MSIPFREIRGTLHSCDDVHHASLSYTRMGLVGFVPSRGREQPRARVFLLAAAAARNKRALLCRDRGCDTGVTPKLIGEGAAAVRSGGWMGGGEVVPRCPRFVMC